MTTLVISLPSLLVVLSGVVHASPYIGAKVGHTWLDDECEVGYLCDDDKSASLGV
ncbi:hypothetical protein [Vibrio aquimaris]|uniref:Uncharacterized protein n=1 Tax=Vibrio aquimaris TaxID=2587862 RepID=A0A5P9CJB1_9VIBR|nr:hypothetical protein [Vibrio aquimaris]QFT26325.1 hypothetical protein FIV01_07785 [Vibrio aquimaris]